MKMGPDQPLPLPPGFKEPAAYIDSLLEFSTTSQLLQTLCGGVHILDFLTRTPGLYSVVLPGSWRAWFADVEINDVLDLLIREDISKFGTSESEDIKHWRNYRCPPSSLIEYIDAVRSHLLCRDFVASQHRDEREAPKKHVFMGMNPKKTHEVGHFAEYVDRLASDMAKSQSHGITHLADFGAGQNYLGRVLASQPYNRKIIAIESRSHVVAGAKSLDVHTKIAKKTFVARNKKAYRASLASKQAGDFGDDNATEAIPTAGADGARAAVGIGVDGLTDGSGVSEKEETMKDVTEVPKDGTGLIEYIEHRIKDGDLSAVIENIRTRTAPESESKSQSNIAPSPTSVEHQDPSLLVMSLHSCGNLVHHGLRTLTLNPAVKAVAMIGCCYNLMTERLGPPTHKLNLRPEHPRLDATAGAYDPQGFPMSERFATYKHLALPSADFSTNDTDQISSSPVGKATDPNCEEGEDHTSQETGLRLNITARMMAVQAPQNWTEAESSAFFTRHFFRALLQRIFLDKGVIGAPPGQSNGENMGCSPAGSSWGMANGDGAGTIPVVIGNLRKKCYETFVLYVRGAVEKLTANGGGVAQLVQERVGCMTDDEIQAYEEQYQARKKELSIVWSLMAFSAGVVEAMVVVDRWLWLKEQPCVEHAWVEPVFKYAKSPRNLVVVGIKK